MTGGFICEHCGLVIEGGLFAEAVYRQHVREHLARAAKAEQQKTVTEKDRIFLRVQKIKWDE